ncbi:hypothetical protein COOONC_01992 [Cooperia oncophora]
MNVLFQALAAEISQATNTLHKVPPKVPPKPAHLKASSTCVSPPPFVSVTSSDTNSIGHSLSNGSVASNVSSEVENRSYSDKENAAAAATIIQADKPKAITEQEPVRVRSQPKEKMTDAQVLEELRQIVNQGDPLQKYEIKRQIGLGEIVFQKENAAAAATIIQADKPKAITEQEPVRVRSQPKEKMTDAQVLEELRQIVNQGDPLQKYEINSDIV